MEDLLKGKILTDKGQEATLRSSLFKLVESQDFPPTSRQIYKDMTFEVVDLSTNYRLAKETQEGAFKDLERVYALERQKGDYIGSFWQAGENQSRSLARQQELNERLTFLQAELAKIQKEMEEINPELCTLKSGIKALIWNTDNCSN